MSDLVQPQTLSAIQLAVATTLKEAELLPTGAPVKPAPGILTEGFLSKNPVSNKGAAFVGIGRIVEIGTHANNAQKVTLRLGVFLVPPPNRRGKQADTLADLVGKLAQFIDGNRFGVSGAGKPSGLFAANHYSQSLDKMGTTLWQIEWTQVFHLFDQDGAVARRSLGGAGA